MDGQMWLFLIENRSCRCTGGVKRCRQRSKTGLNGFGGRARRCCERAEVMQPCSNVKGGNLIGQFYAVNQRQFRVNRQANRMITKTATGTLEPLIAVGAVWGCAAVFGNVCRNRDCFDPVCGTDDQRNIGLGTFRAGGNRRKCDRRVHEPAHHGVHQQQPPYEKGERASSSRYVFAGYRHELRSILERYELSINPERHPVKASSCEPVISISL